MKQRVFRAMGTEWSIHCDVPALLDEAVDRVEVIEARLSRFRPDSSLSRLNRVRHTDDPLLAEVTRAALQLRDETGGAFDPTLGESLAALGYDRSFEAIGTPVAAAPIRSHLCVEVRGDRVSLHGSGALDLGGIAKGWTVDHLVDLLRARGARAVLVDGGGDLRGWGREWAVGVGVDQAIALDDEAVATSSTRKRRWWTSSGTEVHHVLDPRTGAPADGPLCTATVCAPTAMLADVLATSLLVDPEALLPRLAEWSAEALAEGRDGRWWSTPGWRRAA